MNNSSLLSQILTISVMIFLSSCRAPELTQEKPIAETTYASTAPAQPAPTTPAPDAVSAPTNRYPSAPAPVIIYKTAKDYSTYVPVSLSPDNKSIVSYPGVSDVYYQGVLAYPTPLIGGFLLDNRGIDTNAAFLDYSYIEYSKLPTTPSIAELRKHILVKDPIITLYSCTCNRDTAVLNDLIRRNDFSWCTKIK